MRLRRRARAAAHAAAEAPITAADTMTAARDLANAGRHDEAIQILNAANRIAPDTDVALEIRRVRHLAGLALVADAPDDVHYPAPAVDLPPIGTDSRLPEISPAQLTPELLRGAILSHGALLVRGLMNRDKAEQAALDIDRAFAVRSTLAAGESDPDGYYHEFEPEPPFLIIERPWVEAGGGVFAVDSPRLLCDMLDTFEQVGLLDVIGGYLGEPPAISAQKCTLRKATPDVGGAWHQDGRFLGQVRSLNVWLSLSRCGDVAPSIDIVPRRLDGLVASGTEGTVLDYQVSQAVAEEAAGDLGVVRPIFEPGDALLFDDLFLHQTGSDPAMPNARYSIESWFFGPSAYPKDYVPLAV